MNIRDEEACYEATRYLIRSKGKTALVTGQISKSKLLEQRAAGYRRALEEAGEEFDETLIFQGDITFEYGQAAAAQILERGDVSQILATADILARGVINCCRAAERTFRRSIR